MAPTPLPDPAAARARMVSTQLVARGIRSPAVLQAMGAVPRERFVDAALAPLAYRDGPLPIGAGQTISQPYIVARMAEAAALAPGDSVLEVGAGSGYAAAVLGRLAAEVCALERHAALADAARARLQALGVANVDLRHGNGTLGWPEARRFDAIVVSAGGAEVPPALKAQLAPGGRLVMPVGDAARQQLRVLTLGDDGAWRESTLEAVRFVPLVAGDDADG